MTGLRIGTGDYPEEARRKLGVAVTRAREAAGYAWRPAFAEAVGKSVRSIVKLEQGDPVGATVYEAVARALPGWDEDTPVHILAGGMPPPAGPAGVPAARSEPVPESVDLRPAAIFDLALIIAADAPVGEYLSALDRWEERLSESVDIRSLDDEARSLASDRDRLAEMQRRVTGGSTPDTRRAGKDTAR